MKNKSLKILTYILACLPIIAISLLYSKLPAEIPTNWGFSGKIDYSSKSTIWFLALLPLIITFVLNITPRIDPRGKSYERFGKYYDSFCLLMTLFLVVLNGITLSESLYPGNISVSKVCIILVGLIFTFIGNIMPKAKNNFTFGLRTPWTLSNTDVWNKTHRLGGKLFFGVGLLLILSGLFLNDTVSFIITIASTIITVLIPTVMSYIWYNKLTNEK